MLPSSKIIFLHLNSAICLFVSHHARLSSIFAVFWITERTGLLSVHLFIRLSVLSFFLTVMRLWFISISPSWTTYVSSLSSDDRHTYCNFTKRRLISKQNSSTVGVNLPQCIDSRFHQTLCTLLHYLIKYLH